MAINLTKQPSAAARATIMRALKDLSLPENRLGGGNLDISAPLGIYRLGLGQLLEPKALEHAEFIGWRYLLESAGRGTGMADLAQLGSDPARFAGLARNEQATFLLEAAHLAEKVAEDLPGDCEARILIVPALYVSTVWLTTSPPTFIPFLDVFHPVRSAGDVAVRPQFLDDLMARARAAYDRKPEPSATSMGS